MDPRTSAQDVMQCDLCETAVVQMHCDTCLVNLCKACVGEHFSADLLKAHKIVDFKDKNTTLIYPKCMSHDMETCEMYCNQCEMPVCLTCVAADQHLGHKFLKILHAHREKKERVIKEQSELYKTIYPTYKNISFDVKNRLSQIEKKYEDLSTAIAKQGDVWHREIEELVNKLKSEVDEMKNTQLQTLQTHLDEITKTISDIKDEMNSIDIALDSTDISKVFNISPRVGEFRKLPIKIMFSVPEFSPRKIQENQLFGLKPGISEEEEHGYRLTTRSDIVEAGCSAQVKQLLEEPETVTTIDTGYGRLYNVACLSDEEMWTSGNDNTVKLFSINQGSLLKSITTKSGNTPTRIAVTICGDLLYTNKKKKTVNIVKNEEIEVIKLRKWRPNGICSTSSGDLLVIMNSDDYKQCKVVRYSGSSKIQTLQFDDKGNSLYSSGYFYSYITENRNLDICVSDYDALAVVVVNQAGKLRFRYTGHTPAQNNKPFRPLGIATDSQSHILTADNCNDCVHIIDQDGQFLRYIDSGLSEPWGLCTDSNDNLFVAQQLKNEVKKIRYLL